MKHHLHLHALSLLAGAALLSGLAKANDDCTNATPVTAGVYAYDTGPATNGGPSWPCAGGGGPDLWYLYTATWPGSVTIELCGSNYDCALQVFDGDDCASLSSLQCNDDSCGLQSSITFNATAGTSYLFRIGGYAGNTGTGTLTITDSAPPTIGTNYCTSHPNSTGGASTIFAVGSDRAASNDVTLHADTLPFDSFGVFLTSRNRGLIANPGGSQGDLCLSGAIGYFASLVQNSGASDSVSTPIDLTQVPVPGGTVSVVAGDTWCYQYWYRDLVTGVGATSNFSDGVEVVYQ